MGIFIVAEIGINHNGDIQICKDLIDIAADCGCNAIKLQKRDLEMVYGQSFLSQPRESPWGTTQYDQKKRLEFNRDQYKIIDEYCKKKNLDWFASAWDPKSQVFLREFNCKFNKIASAMIVSKKFLKLVAEEKKHTFISTGMCTYEEINSAVEIFKEADCPFELMHTVSTYPMKEEDANLNCITNLKKRYNCKVGYSGHENGVAVSLAALSLNISSLERHITLDRAMYGSDQAASLELRGMLNLSDSIEKMILAYGEEKLGNILEEEKVIAKKLRAHINKKN